MRKVFLILGAVLGVIVAIGIFLFIQSTRPMMIEVPVAINDIPAGTVLKADLFRLTRISNVDQQTTSRWILLSNWPQAEGKVTTSDIRAGFPVARAQVDPNSPDGVESRLSLVLTDTNDYYIVLPTKPDEVGDYLQPGDRIDMIVSLGGMNDGPLVLPITQTQGTTNQTTEVVDPTANPQIPQVMTQTIMPPISKLIMQNMLILRIDRAASGSTAAGSTNQQAAASRSTGDIKRVYVKVTRDQLEVLSFVLNVGRRNIAVRAAMGSQESLPTDGVTWDDFVRWFYAQRGNDADGTQPYNAISPSTTKETAK